MTHIDPQNPQIVTGKTISGYIVKRIEILREIESVFYELEHSVSGARHIHISNTDQENTFSVAFKTVPKDSTGVAHILEHTVLCGSAKFPVRDPFFSMIKRSLNTFMNAFTSSDWTMYPFSTQNRKDYYNLMDVYLDAVFFPRLEEMSFKQEGHRIDVGPDGRLEYKGVVYNEMKGAMSSPNQVMSRSLLNALYPTTTYGFNSGGDPAAIPSLAWEELKSFHKRHYHPSNAYFYTYGNLPLEDHLRFIEERYLRDFRRIDPGTDVIPEIRWGTPREVTYTYPLDKGENPAKKCQVCVGWLTSDINASFDVLALSLLGHILIGNAASPLRKALIDSKLGSSLCDATGYDSDNRDTMFACGLKDVSAEDAPKIEAIIFDTLKNLADKGVEKELISTAIHQIEFRRKERTNTPYPYGIKLLLGLCGPWFHGGDAVTSLRFDEDLDRIREAAEKGTFFENLIRSVFLNNPHRVLFTLVPDQTMAEKEADRVRQELDEIDRKLTDSDRERIKAENATLEELQESEEDLACLPTLNRDDIPKDVTVIHPDQGFSGFPAACYRKPTSGIFYFASAGGIGSVPESMLHLMPFFCSSFTRMGTQKRDYAALARKISAVTGGISLSANSRTLYGGAAESLPFVSFNGKCLNRNIAAFFDIFRECALSYDFNDLDRLKSLLLEYRAGLESSVVQNGHALAISLSTRNFSTSCHLSELWNGVTQLKMIKSYCERMVDPASEKDVLSELSGMFAKIAGHLFSNGNFRFALVGEEEALTAAEKNIGDFANVLAVTPETPLPRFSMRMDSALVREGWSTNTAVSFVGASIPTVTLGHPDAPVLAVISKILKSNYLHREIREKGGAYGGFAIYNSEDGIFSFGSYRDPHIINTLNVFEQAADFFTSNGIEDDDVTEAILQVCSAIDKPETPGPAARKAFYRDIVGLSDEIRREYKTRLLSVTKKDIEAAALRYFGSNAGSQSVAVISGEEKLQEANRKLGEKTLTLNRI